MEDINGGLHPAVDGQSLDEDYEDVYHIMVLKLSNQKFKVSSGSVIL